MTLEPASLQLSVRLMACPSWQFQHFTWGWASHFLIHRCHPCNGHSCWAYGNVDTNIMGPVQGTTRLLCLCPAHRWKQAFQFMLGTLAKSAGIGFASSLQILNFYKLMKKKLIGKWANESRENPHIWEDQSPAIICGQSGSTKFH